MIKPGEGSQAGKSEHDACAIDSAAKRVHDKALPNDESALRTVFASLTDPASRAYYERKRAGRKRHNPPP